jgi:hypothetical protein
VLGVAHAYAGNQSQARFHLERALQARGSDTAALVEDTCQHCHLRSVLARVLWLQGQPEEALTCAHRAVTEALACENFELVCMTLTAAVVVAIWCGNRLDARGSLSLLSEYSKMHALEFYQIWAACLSAILDEGHASHLADAPLHLCSTPLTSSQYADVLCTLGDNLVTYDAIVRVESGRGGWVTCEVQRVKAERLLRLEGQRAHVEVEALLQNALQTAREQDCLAWELRLVTSLARLWRDQNRLRQARDLLSSVYGRFTQGFRTADLLAADEMLQEISTLMGIDYVDRNRLSASS